MTTCGCRAIGAPSAQRALSRRRSSLPGPVLLLLLSPSSSVTWPSPLAVVGRVVAAVVVADADAAGAPPCDGAARTSGAGMMSSKTPPASRSDGTVASTTPASAVGTFMTWPGATPAGTVTRSRPGVAEGITSSSPASHGRGHG